MPDPDLPPAVADSYVCPNGHTRVNPEQTTCEICGLALSPDEGRGDLPRPVTGVKTQQRRSFDGSNQSLL